MSERGFDISNHQSGMDVEGVARANGFTFAFILTNDGTVENVYFARQAEAARRAGAIVLPYVYLRPNWAQTVDIHLRISAGYPASIVDVEDGSGGWSETWNAHRRLWGAGRATPLLYWPRFHWESQGRPDLSPLRRTADNPLGVSGHWKSWYPDRNWDTFDVALSKVPQYVWDDNRGGIPVRVLQFTGTGRVTGYGSNVDLNYFPGSREELAALLEGEAPVTPAEIEAIAKAAAEATWDHMLLDRREGVPDDQRRHSSAANAVWSSWHTMHFGGVGYPSNKQILDAAAAGKLSLSADQQAALLAGITRELDELEAHLTERLGVSRETVVAALADFYRPAVEAPEAEAQ